MRYAYQAYRISGNLLKLHELVGRIRRSRRIRQKSPHVVSNNLLTSLPPFHPKGRHTRFLHLKSPLPQHLYLSFCSVFSLEESCGGSCSSSFSRPLGAPAHAVSIPGVTTTTTTDSTTEPAPEPDIEQKKRPMAHWRMCWIMTPRVKN